MYISKLDFRYRSGAFQVFVPHQICFRSQSKAPRLSTCTKFRDDSIGSGSRRLHLIKSKSMIRCSGASVNNDSIKQESEGMNSSSANGWYPRMMEFITVAFPLITAGCSLFALQLPDLFIALPSQVVSGSLSILMMSMGLTLSPSELVEALRKPVPLALSFVGCYMIMPAIALLLSAIIPMSADFQVGLILLGMISGGQASNLCTYIARGDTALSVAMTTLTTLSAGIMLPFLSQLLLGRLVPVSTLALAISTVQVVLAPITLGVLINARFQEFIGRIKPALPVIGVLATCVIVLKAVATSSILMKPALRTLCLPVIMLHTIGGICGYFLPRLTGCNERTCRTLAIETAFKSPALSYVLAAKHFGSVVAVPSAVSIFALAPLAAAFAVLLRFRPLTET
mmetsp:Transcript_12634/g.22769  ORF Transcript_12634/g.22769 Transcript_12634/m.22769 type:complete len:398 (+) Transcript_12634:75-1268(+)